MISPMPPKTQKAEPEHRLCECGCGVKVQRVQATFLRGHDSRLLRQLKEQVQAGTMTRAAAIKRAGQASAALKAKLTRFLDAAAARQKAEEQAAKAKEVAAKGNGKTKAPAKAPARSRSHATRAADKAEKPSVEAPEEEEVPPAE